MIQRSMEGNLHTRQLETTVRFFIYCIDFLAPYKLILLALIFGAGCDQS